MWFLVFFEFRNAHMKLRIVWHCDLLKIGLVTWFYCPTSNVFPKIWSLSFSSHLFSSTNCSNVHIESQTKFSFYHFSRNNLSHFTTVFLAMENISKIKLFNKIIFEIKCYMQKIFKLQFQNIIKKLCSAVFVVPY